MCMCVCVDFSPFPLHPHTAPVAAVKHLPILTDLNRDTKLPPLNPFLNLFPGGTPQDCPAGQFLQDDVCIDCEAGKYSYEIGATSPAACADCPSGKYAPTTGSSECYDCEAGKFSYMMGASDPSVCMDCPAGKYSPTMGSDSESDCLACGAGKFSEVQGAISEQACQLCAKGKYSYTEGSTSEWDCQSCVAGKFSEVAGAKSEEACQICAKGKYTDTDGEVEARGPECLSAVVQGLVSSVTCGSMSFCCLICIPADTSVLCTQVPSHATSVLQESIPRCWERQAWTHAWTAWEASSRQGKATVMRQTAIYVRRASSRI